MKERVCVSACLYLGKSKGVPSPLAAPCAGVCTLVCVPVSVYAEGQKHALDCWLH